MARRRSKNLRKRYETRRLLYSGCSDEHDHARDPSRKVYDPDFHPVDVVTYFKEAYDGIKDPERWNSKGRVGYVVKPVRPPSAAGYAVKVGVRKETLWAWSKQYTEFEEAMGVAKAFQEAFLVELGTVGALNPAVTNFTLKNLQGWTERVEETHKGAVALQFDAQDADA